MPETNITYFSTPYQIYVEFDNYKGIRFKAKVKEYVEASPDGSGVPVFLYVGFSCRVVLHIESASFNEGAVLAPLSAIVASEENNDKFVFVYNAQSQKVERRQIEESGLVGKDNVIITKGLKAGDQVVSAGATRLVEGQQVKVLTD